MLSVYIKVHAFMGKTQHSDVVLVSPLTNVVFTDWIDF